MTSLEDDEAQLRSVALQNARSILLARQRAEEELLQAKEALRESQERLTSALKAAGTGTFRWNMKSNDVQFDGNLDSLFGLEPGHTSHSFESFIAAVHHEDRDALLRAALGSARDGRDLEMEFRVVWPDGSVHWIDEKAKTVLDEHGKPIYMTGVCSDITSRKAAAEVIRSNEERLRAMFHQAAVGFAVSALDGRFVEANRKCADFLGYSLDELRQFTFAELTHPDDRARTAARVRQLLDGSIPEYSLEKRFLRKDGGVVWSLTTVTLLKDAAGRPLQLLRVLDDITPRKRTEAALREETRTLELLNETGKKLASNLELGAVVQAVTDAATELSGAQFGAFVYNTPGEPRDLRPHATIAGTESEAARIFGQLRAAGLFAPTFRGKGPIRCHDLSQDHRYATMAGDEGGSGHSPVRSFLGVPVRSRSGDVIGGLFFTHPDPEVFNSRTETLIAGVATQGGIAIDNARLYEAAQRSAEERKSLLESERAARSAAERMSKVKDEFLATLSHELRTPLNAILGWAQILGNSAHDRPDLKKGLETIERNARAQTQLIEDLLDMSRITSGKLRLDVQPLSPATIVDSAVESMALAAEAKGIRLEKMLDPAAGPVSGDPNRLQQIIWNLLSNAIKFTPRGGRVQVILARVNSHIEISVADTGIGLKPELVPMLFERFRQADASTTRHYGGLGLGLSIVKSLVELHGGTAWVMSPGEGRGTTVTVSLPVTAVYRGEDPDAREHPGSSSSLGAPIGAEGELGGLKVLVVDDQSDARELIRRVLEDCAAEVFTASSAEEALRMLRTQRVDVLVTDIGMPDVDGFELLRRVRALGSDGGGRVPAIALTAFARSEDRTRALRAGFLVHVSKPVDPAELVATVGSVARRISEAP